MPNFADHPLNMADQPIRAVHPLAPASSPLPLALDQYPLLRTYLDVPDADYLPPIPSSATLTALTTCPRPRLDMATTSFPVGAEVDCWWSEDDETALWGVFWILF
jgi:hypothetical protein